MKKLLCLNLPLLALLLVLFARFGCAQIAKGAPVFSIDNDPFGYAAAQSDAESNLEYLNARYYNPEIARFVSHDSYALMNRYAYADGDPVNKADPSGHMATNDIVGATLIASTVTAALSEQMYYSIFPKSILPITGNFEEAVLSPELAPEVGKIDSLANQINTTLIKKSTESTAKSATENSIADSDKSDFDEHFSGSTTPSIADSERSDFDTLKTSDNSMIHEINIHGDKMLSGQVMSFSKNFKPFPSEERFDNVEYFKKRNVLRFKRDHQRAAIAKIQNYFGKRYESLYNQGIGPDSPESHFEENDDFVSEWDR